MTLAIVTGFAAEARIARAPGAALIIGAGRAERLEEALEAAIAAGARRLLSFGVAGALAADLQPGDLIVGRALVDGATRAPCDPAWSGAMMNCLLRARSPSLRSARNDGPALRTFFADVAGVAAPLAEPAAKIALHISSGAAAVDMESALVARAAERHKLPFAILRAIADPAHRSLPKAALAAMRADGAIDVIAVLGAIARRPSHLPALARLAFDARRALAALLAARALLGADFAGVDLREL